VSCNGIFPTGYQEFGSLLITDYNSTINNSGPDVLGFSGGEGSSSTLRWKSEAESNKNHRSFICRKVKGKAA
jgi:hypothetical protein